MLFALIFSIILVMGCREQLALSWHGWRLSIMDLRVLDAWEGEDFFVRMGDEEKATKWALKGELANECRNQYANNHGIRYK